MEHLTRRDTLKRGGCLLVGTALAGCSERSAAPQQDSSAAGAGEPSRDLYDSGTVPVAASGWTRTRGLGPDYPGLEGDLDTDVLVVGAGLAGGHLWFRQ